MAKNQFNGTIPTQIALLRRLTRIELRNNPGIEGTIPPGMGDLVQLTYVCVRG
jgi:hypothetical protein